MFLLMFNSFMESTHRLSQETQNTYNADFAHPLLKIFLAIKYVIGFCKTSIKEKTESPRRKSEIN